MRLLNLENLFWISWLQDQLNFDALTGRGLSPSDSFHCRSFAYSCPATLDPGLGTQGSPEDFTLRELKWHI